MTNFNDEMVSFYIWIFSFHFLAVIFQESLRVQFAGFERLFARFLQEKGASVDWEKISPPPENNVTSLT